MSGRVTRSATTANKPATLVLPAAADRPVAIVGVGASAGGLEAFTELLSHLPDDTGMAFVLIQHLDPNHKSHLTELLSKVARCPSVKWRVRLAPRLIMST